MTVQELIYELSRFDPETEVYLAYEYSGYRRATLAEKIGRVEDEMLSWSEYHRTHKPYYANDHDGDNEPWPDSEPGIVLFAH